MAAAAVADLAVALRVAHLPMRAVERPAVMLGPQAVDERELLGEHVVALCQRRERDAQLGVLLVVPAGAEAGLDAAVAHLVDRLDHLGQVAGDPERDRRDEGAEPDRLRLARQAGERRPGIGRRQAGFAREAGVMIGSEECLEPGLLGGAGEGQDLVVAEPLLGLGHQGVAHALSLDGRSTARLAGGTELRNWWRGRSRRARRARASAGWCPAAGRLRR